MTDYLDFIFGERTEAIKTDNGYRIIRNFKEILGEGKTYREALDDAIKRRNNNRRLIKEWEEFQKKPQEISTSLGVRKLVL